MYAKAWALGTRLLPGELHLPRNAGFGAVLFGTPVRNRGTPVWGPDCLPKARSLNLPNLSQTEAAKPPAQTMSQPVSSTNPIP